MPLNVYVGYDPRDHLAFEVCSRSLLHHASVPVAVVPLRDWELRHRKIYWREYHVAPDGQMFDSRDGRPFSTQFSFTRFAVPLLEDYGDRLAIYCDPDMLWRADVAELCQLVEPGAAIMVVKHRQLVTEDLKMDGALQTRNSHGRKNWSSLMMMNPARCRALTRYVVNNHSGEFLHSLCWAPPNEIGCLPSEWNHLVGHDAPRDDAKLVHFTLGTPDMVNGPGELEHAEEWWRWAKA